MGGARREDRDRADRGATVTTAAGAGTVPARGLGRIGSGGGSGIDSGTFDVADIRVERFPDPSEMFQPQNTPLLAAPFAFAGGILSRFFGPNGVVGADPGAAVGTPAFRREVELGQVAMDRNRAERTAEINATAAAATRQTPEGSPRGLAGRAGGSQPGADLGIVGGGQRGGDSFDADRSGGRPGSGR